MRLKDRVAIVTGAGKGIGKGIALEFARHGAKVIVATLEDGSGHGIRVSGISSHVYHSRML